MWSYKEVQPNETLIVRRPQYDEASIVGENINWQETKMMKTSLRTASGDDGEIEDDMPNSHMQARLQISF